MSICNNKKSLDKTKQQQKAKKAKKPEKKNSGQLIYKRELKILGSKLLQCPSLTQFHGILRVKSRCTS